jgi:hypothetical protein
LLQSLQRDFHLDLSRFRQVEDLFLPREPQGVFSIWLAAQIGSEKEPDFKLYVNPEARGRRLAPAIVEEALVRLGFGAAWPVVGRTLLRRGGELDELNYFSLDLSPNPGARVKIYARHYQASVADLDAVAEAALSYRAGDLSAFLEAVTPGGLSTFKGRPPQSCYTFVDPTCELPAAATLHFPINSYAQDDQVVRQRVVACLERFDLPTEAYESSLEAFANRPIDQGIGLQSYVSFRRYQDEARVTVYFPLEIYRPGTVAKPRSSVPPSDTVEIASRFESGDRITNHPFLRRLRRESLSRLRLFTLAANLAPLLDSEIAEQFAGVSKRIADPLFRAAFEEQLHAQGAGVFPDTQTPTIPMLIAQLESTVPAPANDDPTTPGHKLFSAMCANCNEAALHEAVGAVLAAKTFGKQIVLFLLDQLRRAPGVIVAPLESLPPEDDLRHGFAELGDRGMPHESVDGLWRGACRTRDATWSFLNDLYALTYGPSVSA